MDQNKQAFSQWFNEVYVARFINSDHDDVIHMITPDGKHWFYINGEWVLHN